MTNEMKLLQLVEALNSLLGRRVLKIYCGESTGSVLDISFSPIKSLAQESLEPGQETIEVDVSLLIKCSWRLQRDGAVLAGSGDSFSDANSVFTKAYAIEGLLVSDVLLPTAGDVLDVSIEFENGSTLKVFCDTGVEAELNQTDDGYVNTDYVVFYGSRNFGIGAGSSIDVEQN